MSQVAKQGGLLAVDCVVICCCCPCVVLQVTVFLFIRLPHKLAVKFKRIILKRLHKRSRKSENGDPPEISKPLQSDLEELHAIQKSGSVSIFGSEEGDEEMDAWIAQGMKFVIDERNTWLGDEKVWKEMLERGVFWFGSFWANGDYL